MKVLLLNIQFERGGAARVAATLSNGLHDKGYDISIVSDTNNWGVTYSLDNKIPVLQIDTKGNNGSTIKKLLKWLRCSNQIRYYIKEAKPDIIIATESMMFLCAWIARIGIRHIPIIAADHTSFNRRIDPIIDFVRYHFYNKSDTLTILTKKDENLLGNKFPQKRVIYNPLPFKPLREKTERKKNILCAGRLEVWEVKGFDIILKIWSKLQNEYPDWTLDIAGSSDNKEAYSIIERMIEQLNLKGRINLLGQVNDMKSLYAQSSIFALPSRMEGFPMVLMEAMSQGCACIAFEVGGASNEMMDFSSGLLIKDGDVPAFQDGLVTLLSSTERINYYSKNAIEYVSRFSEESFLNEWINLINEFKNSKL